MSLDPDARPRYRFGPLERRGLVAGWRGGQIGTVAGALIVAVGVLRSWPSLAGAVVALVCLGVGVAAATWPVAGRTAEEWAPDALRHASSVTDGHRRGRGDPFAGVRIIAVELDAPGVRSTAARTSSARSAAARGTVALAAGLARRGGGDQPRVGVVHDARLRTFSVVLEARAPGFVLLGEQDKAGRVAGVGRRARLAGARRVAGAPVAMGGARPARRPRAGAPRSGRRRGGRRGVPSGAIVVSRPARQRGSRDRAPRGAARPHRPRRAFGTGGAHRRRGRRRGVHGVAPGGGSPAAETGRCRHRGGCHPRSRGVVGRAARRV